MYTVQSTLRIITDIDKYSKFFSSSSVMAEIALNSNISDVRRISCNELFQYMYSFSKSELEKGNIVYAEINLDIGLLKVILVGDRIVSLQLGSSLGNETINLIKQLKQEYANIALNVVKISNLSKNLQITLEDTLKLNISEITILLLTKETTPAKTEEKLTKKIEPVMPKPLTPQAQIPTISEVSQQVYDKIYNTVYSMAKKHKIDIASSTITVRDNEAYIEIHIAPPKSFSVWYSMMISRSLEKFYNELEYAIKNLKYIPKIKIELPEEQMKDKRGTKLPSGEPRV